MKQIIDNGNVLFDGLEFSIWKNVGDQRVYSEIVCRIYDQMSAMLSHHSRILVLRFDFRVDEFSQCNGVVSDFFRVLGKQLRNYYKMRRIGYVWAREKNTSHRQHYHCALILNGNKVNYPDKVIRRIQRIVAARGHPCAYIPSDCYYMVARGDINAFAAAFERISYLAKVDTKGNRLPSVNDYSASRVKHKQ